MVLVMVCWGGGCVGQEACSPTSSSLTCVCCCENCRERCECTNNNTVQHCSTEAVCLCQRDSSHCYYSLPDLQQSRLTAAAMVAVLLRVCCCSAD